MKNTKRVLSETYQLRVLTSKGKKSKLVVPPTELPSDLVPGEFILLPPVNNQQQWWVFCDKQRWWGNGRWNHTGTIHPLDNSLPEEKIYELRRSLLKRFGWIG